MSCNLDINEIIGFQVESTAEWRRRKAEEFPDDQRNTAAAEELDRLAQEVGQLEGSDVHQRICKLIDMAEPYSGIWERLNEDASAALRSVGFHGGFTGTEFLEWYRDELEALLRDHINEDDSEVAAPDLDEQVDNDPEVKAAKQRYEEARAKAYAEARKVL
jgi:hypothetical protein